MFAFVRSRLDCCNVISLWMQKLTPQSLWVTQNEAAVLSNVAEFDHDSPVCWPHFTGFQS